MVIYAKNNNRYMALDTETPLTPNTGILRLWATNYASPDTLERLFLTSPFLLDIPDNSAAIAALEGQIAQLQADLATEQATTQALTTQVAGLQSQVASQADQIASQYDQLSNLSGQVNLLTYEKSQLQSQVNALTPLANIRPPIISLDMSNVYKDVACTQLASIGDTVRGWKSGNFIVTSDNNNLLTINGIEITRTMTTVSNLPKNRLTIEITVYCSASHTSGNVYSTSLGGSTRDFVGMFNASFNWSQYASDNTQIVAQSFALTTRNVTNTIKIIKNYDVLSLYANGTLVASATSAKLQLVPDRLSLGQNNPTPSMYIKSFKVWDYAN